MSLIKGLLQKGSKDQNLVGLHFIFAFLIGSTQTLLMVIPLAIFLSTYSSSLLTYVYMSLGVITFLIGNVFRFFQKNLSFFKLLLSPLIFFSLTLIGFWGLLEVAKFNWLPMAFLIWAAVAYTFFSLVLTNLLLRVFTLQEGKQYFGIIGGVRATGGTLVGFLTPLMVKTLGANTSFLFVPVLIFGAIFVLFVINKRHKDRFIEKSNSHSGKTDKKITFKTLKNRAFVINIFVLAVVSIFNYYSIDLLFNATVKKHFLTEVEIAGFLGVFTAISNIMTIGAGFFLFSLLLNQLGLIITLFLAPLIVGGMTALTLAADFTQGTVELGFALLMVTVLFERMMRQSINGEALNLLYAPLRPDEREWAQLQYRINVQSLFTTLVGVILFGLNRAWGISINSIGWFVIAISFCGVISMLYIQKNYVRILIEALSKWALFKPKFTELDKDSLKIIESRLQSKFPEEVVFALQMIENVDKKEFGSALEEALKNPLMDVRLYTLKKIEEYRIGALADKIREICVSEKDPQILGQALRTLSAIMPPDQFSFFKDYESISGCLVGEILYGPEEIKKHAIDLLTRKLQSAEEKLVGAEALKEVDIPNKADLLLTLFQDPDPAVQMLACEAAGQVKDKRLFSPLVEKLAIPHLHHAASKSLLNLSPLEQIAENFDKCTREQQVQLLKLLGLMEGAQVTEFLQKFLNSSDPKLFFDAVGILKNRHYKATDRERISSLLASANQNILSLKEMIGSLPEDKTKLLRDLLIREAQINQENSFGLLTFIYPKTPILSAQQGLAQEDRNKRSYAMEILQQSVDREHAYLLPELYSLSFPEPSESFEEVLQDVSKIAPKCCIPAIQSAVLYTIGELELKSLAEMVKKKEAPHDPLIEEIRGWTLKRLST